MKPHPKAKKGTPGANEERSQHRSQPQHARQSDLAVISLGGSLALASAAFAAYMLYQGPFRTATGEFDLIHLTREPTVAVDADPIVTGSTAQPSAISRVEDVPPWFGVSGRAVDYRLKAVVARKALVEISSGQDRFTWAAQRGGFVPGIGKVSDISREHGKWVLRIQNISISDRGTELSGQQ